jgi:hypothetical protein
MRGRWRLAMSGLHPWRRCLHSGNSSVGLLERLRPRGCSRILEKRRATRQLQGYTVRTPSGERGGPPSVPALAPPLWWQHVKAGDATQDKRGQGLHGTTSARQHNQYPLAWHRIRQTHDHLGCLRRPFLVAVLDKRPGNGTGPSASHGPSSPQQTERVTPPNR